MQENQISYLLHPNESLKGFVFIDISFKDFIQGVKGYLIKKHKFDVQEADDLINETYDEWQEYFMHGYSVEEAVEEDSQFWNEDEFEIVFDPYFMDHEE